MPRRSLVFALPLMLGAATLLGGWSFQVGRVRLADHPLQPDERVLLNHSEARVDLEFVGLPLAGLDVRVDGHPVALSTGWLAGQAHARTGLLEDGPHRLTVTSGSHEQVFDIVVDTQPPAAQVTWPRPGSMVGGASVTLKGRAEAGASVSAGGQTVAAPPDGAFALKVRLDHGLNEVRWVAADAAGNRTEGSLPVKSDQTPPDVKVLSPGADGVVRTGSPTLKLSALDPESGVKSLKVRIDGGGARTIEPPKDGKPFGHDLRGLPDGRRTLELEARNGLGMGLKRKVEFVVDSTEEFGKAVLTVGARGKDVAELQARLREAGFLQESDIEGLYGDPTRDAVKALQESLGMKADGVAGPYTVGALSGQILVNLARFSLVLVDRQGRTRTYPIAHGTAEYPTPTGEFWVMDMAEDPTWLPPDSPWAREAEAIPPGPGNPLGTRWIGLNNGVVGIHGTPAAWTIGSRASHGCMRMTVPDVEDLYRYVEPGMRVRIFAGDERDPLLEKYWP